MLSTTMDTFCKTDYGSQLPAEVQALIGKMWAKQVLKETILDIKSCQKLLLFVDELIKLIAEKSECQEIRERPKA